MGRKSKTQRLNLWINGESVGQWQINAIGMHEFFYHASWLIHPQSRPVSLSMPLRVEAYKGSHVSAFFDNLLPDSEVIRQRIQAHYGALTSGPFDLLAEIGRDCVGAVQLLPVGLEPLDLLTIKGIPLNAAEIAALLKHNVFFGKNETSDAFRFSIAGAQEKTALLFHDGQWMKPLGSTPTTHILKLPMGSPGQLGIDMSTSVENEWLCEKIMNAYGIKTANSQMMQFEDKKVLVVERFDRKLSNDGKWIMRLPQEDFCQATGTPSSRKYESDGGPGIESIMKILLGSSAAEADRLDFFKTQVIFHLLCAIDGHAKNFSIFLASGGRYHLTPNYDVLSAYPILGKSANQLSPNKAKMAMGFSGKTKHYHWDKILARHMLSTANKVGLEARIQPALFDITNKTDEVIHTVSKIIPSDFNQHVVNSIFDGLSQQSKKLLNQIRAI